MGRPYESGSVSVVIPTHNRVELLRRALRSVVGQTRPADEIIVVDDGSEDATREVVNAEFASVRYLWQANQGVSAARNRGIAESTSRWIAFLDSDDEWRPAKLERQLTALATEPEFRVCHTDEVWIRDGRRVNPGQKHAKQSGWIFQSCLPLCAMSPSSVMIDRSVLDDVGRFDEELVACEDYDLWLRICSRYPVLLVDEPLVVKHGGHPDQLSRCTWGLDRYRIRALENILGSGGLTPADRAATLRTLLEKIDIYTAGVRKRGREAEAAEYLDKRRRWSRPSPDKALVS